MSNRILIHTLIAVSATVCGIIFTKLHHPGSSTSEEGRMVTQAHGGDKGDARKKKGQGLPDKSTQQKNSGALLEGEKNDAIIVAISPLREYCKFPNHYSVSIEKFLNAENRILKLPEAERTEKRYLKETNVQNIAELLDIDEETEQEIYVLIKELVESLYEIEESYIRIERKSPSMFIANLEDVNTRAKPIIAEAKAKVNALLGERRANLFEGITYWSCFQYGGFLSRRGPPQQISFAIKLTPNPNYVELVVGTRLAKVNLPVKLQGNQPFWKQAPKRWRHILKNNALNLE